MLLALAHDLLEIITGDVDTLMFTPEQFAAKHQDEQKAMKKFKKAFEKYPELKNVMFDYEKLDTPEAATVFILDKACTTWTHHADNGAYAHGRGITTERDGPSANAQSSRHD